MHPRNTVRALFVACASSASCNAAVTEYNNNRAAWLSAAGPHSRIDFTGFVENTNITTHYASLGIVFTDGVDRIHMNPGFLNDQWGLNGAFDEIAVAFSAPVRVIAVDHPNNVAFRLYWQGQLTYTSSNFNHGGVGHFAGLISDQPFDAAVIYDPANGVFIDDLYFGPPIPAPGALGLLACAAVIRRSRRRR